MLVTKCDSSLTNNLILPIHRAPPLPAANVEYFREPNYRLGIAFHPQVVYKRLGNQL